MRYAALVCGVSPIVKTAVRSAPPTPSTFDEDGYGNSQRKGHGERLRHKRDHLAEDCGCGDRQGRISAGLDLAAVVSTTALAQRIKSLWLMRRSYRRSRQAGRRVSDLQS